MKDVTWFSKCNIKFSQSWYFRAKEHLRLQRKRINDDRADAISLALSTLEDRESLAAAMCEPIRRSLNYQSLGKKLLMVEELPQGSYAKYIKSV